jgi:N-methylhydantoinase A/oxoprolinase/acetone carboxylase beta subunit
MLINIDNGGTLTDICVMDGAAVHRTKTLTTPHDLSQCLMEGLRKVSREVYGEENLEQLVAGATYIRYSTTQGTNALVERKGPRLGLIRNRQMPLPGTGEGAQGDIFADLVGTRVGTIDLASPTLDADTARAVNDLTSRGANRIVVAFDGPEFAERERALKNILLRAFPSHLLGAVPILYASELSDDPDPARRTCTALFNAFLHPAMERFLYAAERKLRAQSSRNPLLIFRNDGNSARVAKTTAIRTYSSGPRGGMEGARALAEHFDVPRLLTMDVGGTTTDIGLIENGAIRSNPHGRIEGHAVSFPLGEVVSVGVGGSSIIRVRDGEILVGPESVGSAPGPACFGLGGRQATITDALLVLGLLDAETFFGGELKIDADRARDAISQQVGAPLGLDAEAAARAMRDAWVRKIADSLKAFTRVDADLALAVFGGGGPLLATLVADAVGIDTVIVPGLAPVFSAFGIGFSDIAQTYGLPLDAADLAQSLAQSDAILVERARRDMFAEGFVLEDCTITRTLVLESGDEILEIPLDGPVPPSAQLPPAEHCRLMLTARKSIPHASFSNQAKGAKTDAVSRATRRVFAGEGAKAYPLWFAREQVAGASAAGPGVYEEAFSTIWIGSGWRFVVHPGGDLVMSRNSKEA